MSRSQGVAYRRRTTSAFPAGGAADAPQATMATRYFGERIRRNEDPRLLTGGGTFVDDITLPDLLHAALLRSPHAHARVHRVDTGGRRRSPVSSRCTLTPTFRLRCRNRCPDLSRIRRWSTTRLS